MQTMKVTADQIHNLHAPYIRSQVSGYSSDVREAMQGAHRRHHQKGTDASDEADAINTKFGFR